MRKEQYLAHLCQASPEALRVSAADKLHNARAILADYRELGDQLWTRFNASRSELLRYYTSLAAVFRERGPRRLGDELDRVVGALQHLAAAGEP